MNWYDRHKDGWILKACCSFKWQTAMVLSLFPPSRLLHSFVRAFCSSSHHSIHQWCWGQIWRQASPPVFYFTLALSPCCSFVKTVSCAKYDKTNSEKGYYFFFLFFFYHWWWNKHAVRQCQGKYPGMTFSTDWVNTPQPICCTKFRLQQPQEVRQSNKVQFTAVKYSACVKTDIEIHWLDWDMDNRFHGHFQMPVLMQHYLWFKDQVASNPKPPGGRWNTSLLTPAPWLLRSYSIKTTNPFFQPVWGETAVLNNRPCEFPPVWDK